MSPSALAVNAAGVKAKRRRTSPQDHAILEAAYQKNSKPDKVQRAQIVSQVSLGEKEVQIWFQNRRQNDRRRSKPLEPHELVAHLRNNTASPTLVQGSSSPGPEDSTLSHSHPNASLAPAESINRPASRASSIHDLLNPARVDEGSPNNSTQETADDHTFPSTLETTSTQATKDMTAIGAQKDVSKDVGSLSESSGGLGSARKRNHDEMAGLKSPSSDLRGQSPSGQTSQSKEPLARTSSFVRLAMTVDGAVKVRTRQEDTPSPEKPRPSPPVAQVRASTPMSRSKSVLSVVDVYRDGSHGTGSRAVGSGFGRSRDARTWEFYCDSNTKDALSTQAEAETAGSAVSAINLIRSNSFKSRVQALSPSLSKINARLTSSKNNKPKLSRAKSSLGRLQGLKSTAEPVDEKDKAQQGHVRSPSGDSDKENWAPGTRLSEHALRRTQPSGRQRPVLQENEEMTFPDASSSQKRRNEEADRRLSPTKEKAKGEEMDCVQGLLSLSQGAWTMK
ncbi:hypothetical protein A1O7_09958 [Cladophialophora yegresii CBS 114405]|uniref:Homeobox domain-containing protein n=1 Tax=Cladophialophora yegresii CBS 114405 TaxID=1182544 RepID=W9VG58_9EURO|nr:uncharacterized protein A1O7_09958 [Cladophialophora yegresii CBS 114405]EXJ54617.1 hypothetical protein A1O7_09958 [Cladophialophora yegresii CBS 114405]